MNSGWKNKNRTGNSPEFESMRHGMSAMGIPSKALSEFASPEAVKHYQKFNKRSGKNEWIADIDFKQGKVRVTDYQPGNRYESFLDFDNADQDELIGYIHRHPEGIHPDFSLADYALTVNIAERRNKTNLNRTLGWTVMGLVTPKSIMIYRLKPSVESIEKIKNLNKQSLSSSEEIEKVGELKTELMKKRELKKITEIELR